MSIKGHNCGSKEIGSRGEALPSKTSDFVLICVFVYFSWCLHNVPLHYHLVYSTIIILDIKGVKEGLINESWSRLVYSHFTYSHFAYFQHLLDSRFAYCFFLFFYLFFVCLIIIIIICYKCFYYMYFFYYFLIYFSIYNLC